MDKITDLPISLKLKHLSVINSSKMTNTHYPASAIESQVASLECEKSANDILALLVTSFTKTLQVNEVLRTIFKFFRCAQISSLNLIIWSGTASKLIFDSHPKCSPSLLLDSLTNQQAKDKWCAHFLALSYT